MSSSLKKRSVLGRGLESIFSSDSLSSSSLRATQGKPFVSANKVNWLGIEQLQVNPNQPRKIFDKHSLKTLEDSIRKEGLIQPIVAIQKEDQRYEIVAGERRWRAASKAGLHKVPVWIIENKIVDEAILALVEDLQREDLNPIELAQAYQRILKEKNWTQEHLAEAISIPRTSLTNCLRLLQLHPKVQEMILEKRMSVSIAKILLREEDLSKQLRLAKLFVRKNIDTQSAEKMLTASQRNSKKTSVPLSFWQRQSLRKIEDIYGIKGSLVSKKKGGQLCFRFYSTHQLHSLMDCLLCPSKEINKQL